MPPWLPGHGYLQIRLLFRIVEWTEYTQQPQTPGWTSSSLYTTLIVFLGGHAHRCSLCV